MQHAAYFIKYKECPEESAVDICSVQEIKGKIVSLFPKKHLSGNYFSVHCAVLDTSEESSQINVNDACFQKTCLRYFNAGLWKYFLCFVFLAEKVISHSLTAGILMIFLIYKWHEFF